MYGRTFYPIAAAIAFLLLSQSAEIFAQERLPYDQEVQGQLSLQQTNISYLLDANQGSFLEVILAIDGRDFDLYLSLIDPSGNRADTNQGINYPQFQGGYIFHEVETTGDYTLQIEANGITEPTDFTIYYIEHASDEADREIGLMGMKQGTIGPAGDFDLFFMSMRQGNTVLLIVNTPNHILDSMIAVFDPDGNFIAYNDNFFGTGSMLLFTPEVNGYHQIMVQGAFETSAGPYQLIANPVPFYQPPFSTTEEITVPGDAFVYRFPLETDTVYDFSAAGVDGFVPIIALTDGRMNVIADNTASAEIPMAYIPGFTPMLDEDLYLFVMGDSLESLGGVGAEVEIKADEEDGALLEHGNIMAGTIGPIGDVDEYRFNSEPDTKYSILVTPTWHYLDPAVRVIDGNNAEIFFNDNSADGVFPLLSDVQMPEPGEYRIQVLASPTQEHPQRLTGVYVIQLVTAATFDRGAPRINENDISLTPTTSGVHISIPTSAVADDTYPLSATMTLDRDSRNVFFEIDEETPIELDIVSQPDEIFFLTVSDSSNFHHSTTPITLPAPMVISSLEGMPSGMAIDHNNTMYVTDSQHGRIIKITVDGATEVLLAGEETKGGTFGPNALAFDRENRLFLSNAATYSVLKVSPDGTTEAFNTEVDFPVDIAFDENGALLVAQLGSDTVDRIGPGGAREPYVTGINNPNGLAFSPDGNLYICNAVKGESGIYRVLDDGTIETFVEPFAETLQGIAFDREGFLYVADGIAGLIYRISPEGEKIVFTRGLSGPVDLAFGYGEYSKTLFASSMGIEANGLYIRQIIAIPTGRIGLPLPYNPTGISHWFLMD